MNLERDIASFQEALLSWFAGEKENFPWRQTTDPWAILVSEVMLQQTQVATVLGKGFYVNFLERFPDVKSISKASEQEILKAWEGLGYYRRVRNLQKTAQAVVTEYEGVFPSKHSDIIKLPGIGPYTAGAVASFAFNQAQPIVDANVARLFSRIFNFHELIDSTKGGKQLWSWAEQLLHHNNPREYNSALMELGQKVCKNKNPQCMLCPVRNFCTTDEPEALPKKKPKRKTVEVLEQCIWVIKDNKILLSQAPNTARREGMWSLPLRDINKKNKPIYEAKYGITHHKVTLKIYMGHTSEVLENEVWHPLDSLESLPMPSPYRKAVNALL